MTLLLAKAIAKLDQMVQRVVDTHRNCMHIVTECQQHIEEKEALLMETEGCPNDTDEKRIKSKRGE